MDDRELSKRLDDIHFMLEQILDFVQVQPSEEQEEEEEDGEETTKIIERE